MKFKLPILYGSLTYKEKREVRYQYIKMQHGECFHCKHNLYGEPPDFIVNKKINWKLFPQGFLKYPIHLHHSHKTGLTIGAVHAYCNAVLFQYHGK